MWVIYQHFLCIIIVSFILRLYNWSSHYNYISLSYSFYVDFSFWIDLVPSILFSGFYFTNNRYNEQIHFSVFFSSLQFVHLFIWGVWIFFYPPFLFFIFKHFVTGFFKIVSILLCFSFFFLLWSFFPHRTNEYNTSWKPANIFPGVLDPVKSLLAAACLYWSILVLSEQLNRTYKKKIKPVFWATNLVI